MGELFSAFRWTNEGQSVLPALSVSLLCFFHNIQHGKVVYLGAIRSQPHHYQDRSVGYIP